MKIPYRLSFALLGSLIFTTCNAATLDDVLDSYQAAGATTFSAARGETLWTTDHPDPESPGKVRNCSTCHGKDLSQPGRHVNTGKEIEAMAPSVNDKRYTNAKTIEKWFTRNCKWVLGRECMPQEKGDVLSYLRTK
ncbi:MAG: DUF1924 domain-containing protein [Gammaproteobacteria bacterium]|nr:DUF1924 domain-containing protein [Gammaproteobacteria bacterium]